MGWKFQREGQCESSQRSIFLRLEQDESCYKESKERPDGGDAPAHPAVEQPHVPSRHGPVIQPRIRHLQVAPALPKRADRVHALQRRLVKVEHGGLGDALEALDGQGAAQVDAGVARADGQQGGRAGDHQRGHHHDAGDDDGAGQARARRQK